MRRDKMELHLDPTIIEINVGGEVFMTSLQTLQREVSVLTGVPPRHDKDGRMFIDRDPTYFRWILNYLRDGYLVAVPPTQQERLELLQEARWYHIAGLITLLEQQQQIHPPEQPAKEVPTFLTARPSSKGIFYFPELKWATLGYQNPNWDLLGVKFEDGKDDVSFFSLSVNKEQTTLAGHSPLICQAKLLVDRIAKTEMVPPTDGQDIPPVDVCFWWEPSATQYPQLYMRLSRGDQVFFQKGVDFLRTVSE